MSNICMKNIINYHHNLLYMNVYTKIKDLQDCLIEHKKSGNTIGFVPTMGALHFGHISLIESSNTNNNITVCSIFINPTQFNNNNDLLSYPRTTEADLELLKKANCDIVFLPDVETMYPKNDTIIDFNFGSLELVMEGKDRPGHFQGVGTIVKKLFDIVEPNNAYFGKKDYQQLLIIKELTRQYKLSPKIIGCEIIRENDGLAMSSRNTRLTKKQRAEAPFIRKTMLWAKENMGNYSPNDLTKEVEKRINSNPLMEVNYFEISETDTLIKCEEWKDNTDYTAFVVVSMGDIRLIDNIELF